MHFETDKTIKFEPFCNWLDTLIESFHRKSETMLMQCWLITRACAERSEILRVCNTKLIFFPFIILRSMKQTRRVKSSNYVVNCICIMTWLLFICFDFSWEFDNFFVVTKVISIFAKVGEHNTRHKTVLIHLQNL